MIHDADYAIAIADYFSSIYFRFFFIYAASFLFRQRDADAILALLITLSFAAAIFFIISSCLPLRSADAMPPLMRHYADYFSRRCFRHFRHAFALFSTPLSYAFAFDAAMPLPLLLMMPMLTLSF